MLSVEERLRRTDDGFPAHAVDPSASLDRVVRKGRLHLAVARLGTGLATVAVVAAGVVAVPQLVGPPSPEVITPLIEPADPATQAKEASKERETSEVDRGEPSDLAFVPDRPVAKGSVEDEPAGEPKTEGTKVEEPAVKDPAPKPEPKPDPKTEEPAPAPGFTAAQWQTHVEHDPPYNKYHGTAAPGTEIRAGNEYGSGTGVADAKGNWYVKVWFEDAPYGTHTFTVTVESSAGHRQTFEMTATRPDPKTEEPATGFTAHQHLASVEHDPPYNKYHGTAAPGTEIRAGNEYGSASTVADAKGNWYVKVWFEDAPYGTHTFTVAVESSAGHHQTFEMTATRPEKEAAVAFSAYQKWSTTDGDPPSNVYWGTARPNTQVNVISEYGSVETVADADGNWDATVTFSKAPAGTKTFTVKVKSLATGEYQTFEVTTVRPA